MKQRQPAIAAVLALLLVSYPRAEGVLMSWSPRVGVLVTQQATESSERVPQNRLGLGTGVAARA